MRSVRLISVVVLVVLCFLLIASPVAAGTTSWTELDWSEDFVEVESNLHDPADKGTHSAFANMQALDLTNDTLTEANQNGAGFNLEDYVDALSNLHDPTDIGTETSFAAMQVGPDQTNNTMTEECISCLLHAVQLDNSDIDSYPDVGTQGTFLNVQSVDAPDSSYMTLTEVDQGGVGGTTEYIAGLFTDSSDDFASETNAYDGDWGTYATNTIFSTADDYPCAYADGFDSGAAGSGTITQVDIIIRMSITGLDASDSWGITLDVGASVGNELRALDINDYALNNLTFTDVAEPNDATWTWAEIRVAQVHLDGERVAGSDLAVVDIYEYAFKVTVAGSTDYELDMEYQWSDTNYSETYETVCFYIQTATVNGDYLKAWEWTGSDWASLGNVDSDGWNNLTAAYLTASNFYIKLNDSDQATEGTESIWNMDNIFLNSSAGVFMQLDLEYGWTTADNDEANEELCIFAGPQGAEALLVDVWNDTAVAYINVIADLVANQWNNVSVASHLVDTSFEIRFRAIDGADENPDSWEIDVVTLHTWSVATVDYELDLEVGWTVDTDYDETVEQLCIFAGPQNAEALQVDVWDGSWTNVIADLTANQWNNVSITSYLTGVAFEIRFVDSDQADDATLSTWEIDAVLIRVYSYAYKREDYEGMGLSDVESTAVDYSRGYEEAFALSGIERFAVDFARALEEAIDLSETYSRALTLVRVYEEAFAVSEVVAPAANFALALLEALGIAAFLTSKKSIVKALEEAMALSDTYGTAATLIRTYSETFNLSDGIANVLSLVRTYGEAFNLSDVESMAAIHSHFYFEVINVSDISTTAGEFARLYYDAFGISEISATAVVFGKLLGESIDLSDVYVTAATLVRGFGEAIGLTDMMSTEVFLTKFLYETITVVEDYGTAVTLIRIYNESIGVSDVLTTAATLFRTYGEQFNISEFESVARIFERTYYETFGLSEVEATVVGFSRILYDSITTAAAKALSADFVRNMAEAVTVVATIETIKTGGEDYVKNLFERFDISEFVVASGGFFRDFYESIALAGFNENVKGYYKVMFESIVVGAFRENVMDYGKILFESILASETSPFETVTTTTPPDGRPRTDDTGGNPGWVATQIGAVASVVGLGILSLIGAYSEYKDKRDKRPTYVKRREKHKKGKPTYAKRRAKHKEGRPTYVERRARRKKGDDTPTYVKRRRKRKKSFD